MRAHCRAHSGLSAGLSSRTSQGSRSRSSLPSPRRRAASIDPQSRKSTEPPEQIKRELAALKADKSVPEMEKREGLAQLEAALKNAKPIQFKETSRWY
jgi:hypothetical protein